MHQPEPLPMPTPLDPADLELERQLVAVGAPAPSAAFDRRMAALLAQPTNDVVAAKAGAPPAPHRLRPWHWFAGAGLAAAAGFALAISLRHAEPLMPSHIDGPTGPVANNTAPAPIFENGVPVGYQLREERSVCDMDTPMGTVTSTPQGPRRALLRQSLMHQTWEHPESHATCEFEAPRRQVILVPVDAD